ncbi:MAG: tagaturonate reductase, partial [Lentisphaeria bacterium]|nr:tagaturonate reductase [Lentisphaeria bacterium]
MPEKIIQFGEGNFLRAFVDWMVNALNAGDAFNGSVVIAQPLNAGLADMINGQDGLYTLLMRGLENGEAKECR